MCVDEAVSYPLARHVFFSDTALLTQSDHFVHLQKKVRKDGVVVSLLVLQDCRLCSCPVLDLSHTDGMKRTHLTQSTVPHACLPPPPPRVLWQYGMSVLGILRADVIGLLAKPLEAKGLLHWNATVTEVAHHFMLCTY